MKWIIDIKKVEPYKVACQWNDGKVRVVDLMQFIESKSANPENSYAQLKEKSRFEEVRCDGSTLYWEDGLEYEDYDGQIKKGPLDISPDFLFGLTEDGKMLNRVLEDN
tara:strand:+ start:89 stop:412 length:324 start_codon:yes stop_codon:yes gene_type:complete